MAISLPIENYQLEAGSASDRARLVKFMQRAYGDLGAINPGAHLADTVQRHFSAQSQLWWLISNQPATVPVGLPGTNRPEPVGCLWQGEAVDQRTGVKQAYVFLLYVAPDHRHQGLGMAMMEHAQQWAKQQGYGQIGLQVFEDNVSALNLYQKLGYRTQARWLSLEI